MSFSLPGTDLYYLPRDDLAPEKYEEIISPYSAWWHIDSKYVFDDRPTLGFQLINMYQRDVNGYTNQLPPHGPREREKLRRMLFSGEVVMLGGSSVTKGELFYIDEHGELICRNPLAYKFDGARDIIREYKRSVARRDYSRRGGKPRPTVLPARQAKVKQSAPLNIINSKTAGRLLAAGGMYNGNPDGFRQTAEQLGGDALAGYQQMMSDEVKGLLIAGASVAAAFGMGHLGASSKIFELRSLHVLGKVEGEYSMIKPGPLPNDIAGTFSGGIYKEIILSTDTTFFRGGVANRPLGQFFGYEQPQGILQTRIDKALLPRWPNGNKSPLDSYHKIQIPAGTRVYVGEVGYQNALYSGGTEQVLIMEPWEIPGVKVLSSGGLK
ncbi:hypothetical protein ACQE32_01685 [Pantoea sp. FN0302]|uniref:hypothetical protein n=1 Tax=unclassified Pantoea TaxID=2630326 RepID=UPI003CE8509D